MLWTECDFHEVEPARDQPSLSAWAVAVATGHSSGKPHINFFSCFLSVSLSALLRVAILSSNNTWRAGCRVTRFSFVLMW